MLLSLFGAEWSIFLLHQRRLNMEANDVGEMCADSATLRSKSAGRTGFGELASMLRPRRTPPSTPRSRSLQLCCAEHDRCCSPPSYSSSFHRPSAPQIIARLTAEQQKIKPSLKRGGFVPMLSFLCVSISNWSLLSMQSSQEREFFVDQQQQQ